MQDGGEVNRPTNESEPVTLTARTVTGRVNDPPDGPKVITPSQVKYLQLSICFEN